MPNARNKNMNAVLAAAERKAREALAENEEADPANLTAAPVILKVRWVKGSSGSGAGALREPIGLGGWFREQITAYDRPRAYSYRVVRSIPPFDHEGGTLTFTPSADGTHVDWLTSYTHPAYAGGKLMEAVSLRLLR